MRSSRLSAALTVSLVMTACSKSPSAPSSPGLGGTTPPADATITAVRVDGPARVAPGETARYVAIATYTGGSSKDLSSTASWNPTTLSSPLYFTGPGTAVGGRPGDATVSARIGAMLGSTAVLVIEKGTFKLSGRIVESSARPLQGVSIDVVSGVGAGLHATADAQGHYTLYGVAGATQLRVSRDGFTAQMRSLVVTEDTVTEDVTLAPRDPPAAIAGDWNMTLTASPACSNTPADIARGRSYQMQIHQLGTGVTYVIGGPTVTSHNPQHNTGVLFGAHLTLHFVGDTSYGDWSTGNIVDRLSPTETMQFNGTLEGDLTASHLIATLSGDIVYWDQARPSFAPNWYCRATDHVVILRKQEKP